MTKPRPPRPVRAWAETVSATDRRIACDQWGCMAVAKTRERCALDSMNENAKPIRVTLVPDGATSAEAERRRLRRENKRLRVALRCVAHDCLRDPSEVARAALRRKGGSR